MCMCMYVYVGIGLTMIGGKDTGWVVVESRAVLDRTVAGGVKVVDVIHAELSEENQAAILAHFMHPDSKCRVLFASVVIGMGTHLLGLYFVWRVRQPRKLLTWIQEFGRVGRDGEQSIARLYYTSKFPLWESCMEEFCTSDECLQLKACRLFDKNLTIDHVRAVQRELNFVFCCNKCQP